MSETIADGSYPISRPLFFYIKNAHRGVIPGFNEFLDEYMSEEALAPGGYLEERGLVPLSDTARAELARARGERGHHGSDRVRRPKRHWPPGASPGGFLHLAEWSS